MEKASVSTALGSAIAVGVALAMSSFAATAQGLPLMVNNEPCGTYTSVVFDKNGHLKLAGNLSCLGGGDPGPIDPDPDPGPIDPDPGPIDPEVPAHCGTAPSGLIAKYDHPWDQAIATNIRNPIGLATGEVYAFKINQPGGVKGYGDFNHINTTGRAGVRTVVISECPGSMKPAGVTLASGYNACKTVSSESKVTWTFDASTPRGSTQCRLDANKQYYINVKHQAADGQETCAGGKCFFTYGYQRSGVVN